MKTGTLWLAPTPVGNLGDITQRAIETLRSVAVIACEDTRTTAVLLRHYSIDTPMLSYHKFNERSRAEQLLERLRNGEDVAVVSDAGSPGISDPSGILVRLAIQEGLPVSPLPGATALVPALTASGFDTARFYFAGFAPAKVSEREALLLRLAAMPDTLVFYEAPHRIRAFLAELLEHLGDRRACLAREISKHFESFHRGKLSELLFAEGGVVWKGEFVVVIKGATPAEASDDALDALLRERLAAGDSRSDAVKAVCRQTGAPRNRVYERALSLKEQERRL
ncbi:MAG: 16S rRNA (cytidine(1402)-2'-O)-methyltransferase [Candidatus Cloacimonetes bacterium]|nr:16S rRNA (cytidine(1402)-2'-O)-methyltransferase [Candidatus Cloacimonadota bacterium]